MPIPLTDPFTTEGLALDLKLGARTFAGIQLDRLTTDVERSDGVYVLQNGVAPGTTREALNYEEYDVTASLNRLLGNAPNCAKSFVTRAGV